MRNCHRSLKRLISRYNLLCNQSLIFVIFLCRSVICFHYYCIDWNVCGKSNTHLSRIFCKTITCTSAYTERIYKSGQLQNTIVSRRFNLIQSNYCIDNVTMLDRGLLLAVGFFSLSLSRFSFTAVIRLQFEPKSTPFFYLSWVTTLQPINLLLVCRVCLAVLFATKYAI